MQYAKLGRQSGVGFFGAMTGGDLLNGPRYAAFVKEWSVPHITEHDYPDIINATAPFLCVLELLREKDDSVLRAACEQRASLPCPASPCRRGPFNTPGTGMARCGPTRCSWQASSSLGGVSSATTTYTFTRP